jgi:hypothetical protein
VAKSDHDHLTIENGKAHHRAKELIHWPDLPGKRLNIGIKLHYKIGYGHQRLGELLSRLLFDDLKNVSFSTLARGCTHDGPESLSRSTCFAYDLTDISFGHL